MRLVQQLLEGAREKLIGGFKNGVHHWMPIPPDDPAYDSDHEVTDHTDLGLGRLDDGRWRYDSAKPKFLVWSDEPTDEQKDRVVEFLSKRGHQVTHHRVWWFSDDPQRKRVVPHAVPGYARDGD